MDAAAEAGLAESDGIFTVKEEQRNSTEGFFLFAILRMALARVRRGGGDVPQCRPVTPTGSLEL